MLWLLTLIAPAFSKTANVKEFVHSAQLFATKCDSAAEDKIWNCGNELDKMGVFSQSGVQRLSIAELKSRNQTYFIQMCEAYNRYNKCLSSPTMKHFCYQMEPMKSRVAVVDAALEYVCGAAYEDMIANWACYLRAATSDELSRCEISFVQLVKHQETMYNEYPIGAGACFALQTYTDCIRPSIADLCGKDAFTHVLEAIERPVHVYLPQCALNGSTMAHKYTSLIISLIFFVFVKLL
ncbi:unnamed protein product, partial [Mesorhabditis belari]|uniref:Uncharacterized protein n=1 Tax=Mesorhabditis belari TaxID=2138241 RepID=A0AAF3J4H7_9BILA